MRFGARGYVNVLAAVALVATQCLTFAPRIKGQVQSPPAIDFPSLAGKSMGDVIDLVKGQKKKCKEVDKDFLARIPPETRIDDICYFKTGGGLLTVATYQGRAVGFIYLFEPRASSEPEDALRRVGINVNGAMPQIQEGPVRYYIWSGTFNGKKWNEIKVHQVNLKNRNCPAVFAFLSGKTE